MADSEITSNASTSRPGSPAPSLPTSLPPTSLPRTTPATGFTPGSGPSFRFTWERKRGPGSVSNFSEVESHSRHDFIGNLNAARGELQGLQSQALASDALGAAWSSSRHGFHAISTVLNHPTKKAAPPKAHSTLPTVVPADLPRVRRRDFDPYLKDIKPHWEDFQKSLAQSAREREAANKEENDAIEEEFGDIPASPLSPSQSTSSTKPARIRHLTPLETVPTIFFDPSFTLTSPSTFSLVTESPLDPSGLLPSTHDPASISYSVPLLEKLSHYADTVESHLVQEIQARSSSFFSALGNLHDLQSESERCLRRIADLKAGLQRVDDTAGKGLELVKEDQKISQLQRLEDGVGLIKQVQEMRGIAKGLAGAGEWSDALNVVDNIKALLDYSPPSNLADSILTSSRSPTTPRPGRPLSAVDEEPSTPLTATPALPPIDSSKLPASLIRRDVSLRQIHAFSNLPDELRTLSSQIALTLSEEFATVLRTDLSSRISLDEGTAAAPPNEEKKDDEVEGFRERLSPLVLGLMRTGDNGLKDGLERWREVVMSEIRVSMKRHLDHLTTNMEDDELEGARSPSSRPSMDRGIAERTASLAKSLTELSQEDWMKILRRIYNSLLACLKGARAQANIIQEVVDQNSKTVTSPTSPRRRDPLLLPSHSRTPSSPLQSSLNSVLFVATELAHKRISKLLLARSEQHSQLKLIEFWIFHSTSWEFVLNCERVAEKMVVALRGTLGGQSTAFLQAFHNDKLTRSAKWVEQEEWKNIEVSTRSQRVADLIINSAVSDPVETIFIRPSDPNSAPVAQSDSLPLAASPDPAQPQTGDVTTPGQENGTSSVTKSKYLKVEDHSFYIVPATLQVLGLVLEYLKVMVNLPNLGFESMNKLIEFLKAFNSRTCQVVLGAGAIRSAGLKNISARHLALASQSLSIMISLIPYIREAYRRHLDPKQFVLLTEFDKLKRDFQEHHNEIHSKLVSIMGEAVNAHIKSLQSIQWELPPPPDFEEANPYMKDLVKQTVTLYKVLIKFLGPTATEPIMSECFATINHRLGEEYQNIPLTNLDAKERMLTDARYLHEKLSALRGVGSLSSMVVTIVQEKAILSNNTTNTTNGVTNGVSPGTNVLSSNTSTPRPRGSIDLQSQPRANPPTRQSTLGTSSNNMNLAARPSPFAKRTLASLFGGEKDNATGVRENASSSTVSLLSASGEGTSGPGTPRLQPYGSGLAIGSSGGGTPELMDGRASPAPATLPSPPYTPGSTAQSQGFRAVPGAGDEGVVGPLRDQPPTAEENTS